MSQDFGEEVISLYEKLDREAKAGGYNLNPDKGFTLNLVKGLYENERRYGYMSCPCRLAIGNRADDLDIICPCDYRDPDLNQYDTCYCGLYVSSKLIKNNRKPSSIPERRPSRELRQKRGVNLQEGALAKGESRIKVWRCRVCGYLCAREEPPEKCPVCKADKDRFEVFVLK
ncbi:MAG: ferredoxin:glutaredoxin reductase [Actinobacteria bacterium]|nr:ferredoxin:glutaredoxin reductase [Actinomycetota bacterium]